MYNDLLRFMSSNYEIIIGIILGILIETILNLVKSVTTYVWSKIVRIWEFFRYHNKVYWMLPKKDIPRILSGKKMGKLYKLIRYVFLNEPEDIKDELIRKKSP